MAVKKKPVIKFIEMPEVIRDKYQYFTQANLLRLHGTGYDTPVTSLETPCRTTSASISSRAKDLIRPPLDCRFPMTTGMAGRRTLRPRFHSKLLAIHLSTVCNLRHAGVTCLQNPHSSCKIKVKSRHCRTLNRFVRTANNLLPVRQIVLERV